jgi:hypothetical protein
MSMAPKTRRRRRRLSPEHRANIAAALKGRQFSAETRARMSEALKGRQFSAEHRANISAAKKGRPLSAETRARMSEAQRGHVVAPETRARISEANKGRQFSPQSRANISAAVAASNRRRAGHQLSADHREKISAALKGRPHSAERRDKLSKAMKGRRYIPKHLVDQVEAILDQKPARRQKPAGSKTKPRPAIDPGSAARPMSVRGVDKSKLSESLRKALGILAKVFPGGLNGKQMTKAYGGTKGWEPLLRRLKLSDADVNSAVLFPRDRSDDPADGLYRLASW